MRVKKKAGTGEGASFWRMAVSIGLIRDENSDSVMELLVVAVRYSKAKVVCCLHTIMTRRFQI